MPDFTDSALICVTASGRASKITASTPSGQLTLCSSRPVSSSRRSRIRPLGSGSSATARTPRTISASFAASRCKRFSKACESSPDFTSASASRTSSAFAARISAAFCSSAFATASSAAFFCSELTVANLRLAALAAFASSSTFAFRSIVTGALISIPIPDPQGETRFRSARRRKCVPVFPARVRWRLLQSALP